MSRNLPSKAQNASYASLTNTIKSRISPSPKNRPARLGTRSMTKSPTQTFIHNNSKVSESNISKSKNLKSKKDILAEISPQDRIELTQGSGYDGRHKNKSQKQNNFSNEAIVQSMNQKSKNKGGELIKKIVSRKGSKANAQKETKTREISNKRIRDDLRYEEQDVVYDQLDLPNNFMSPLSFVKSLQMEDSKKKEAKLSSSVILNPEHYRSMQHQQNDSRFQSMTNVSRNASTQMNSRNGSNKFTDIEMELDLNEKRQGHYKRISSDAKHPTSQDSDSLSSNAYKLFKYQRSQERAKLEASAKNSRISEAAFRSPGYSTKISPRKETPDLTESDNLGPKNCTNCENKASGDKILKKRKKTGHSPNKTKNYSTTGEKSTELYKNRGHSPNITQGQNIISESILYNEASRKSPSVFAENRELLSEPYSSSCMSKGVNNSCTSPNSRQTMLMATKERFGTEPQGQTKGGLARMQAFFREKTSTPQAIVDLDQMNVKQLIQLKNIIDEKIEVEELRNKTEYIKTDPRLKKTLRSPGEERLSQQKRLLKEQLNQDENSSKVSTTKNLRQPDILYEKAIWRAQMSEEKLPLSKREGLSFNMSYMRESNLKKHDISSPQFNLSQPLQGDNVRGGYASYSHWEPNYKDSRIEIEENYNKKLREFLEARDKMLQITDASVEEVDLDKYPEQQSRTAPTPALDGKSYNGFISLSNLLKMNPPEYLRDSDNQNQLKYERELMMRSMISPTASKQISQQKGSQSCLDDIQERLETAKSENEFEPLVLRPKETTKRKLDFTNLKVQARKNMQDNDLMAIVNKTHQRDVHKDKKSGQRTRSSETGTRLTKKEMNDIISRANDIEDTPSESNDDDIRRGNYYKQEFKLAKDNTGLSRILNPQVIMHEDSSVLETPTLNPNNMDSKNTSTIVETDLSILAINKKLAVMRTDLDDLY